MSLRRALETLLARLNYAIKAVEELQAFVKDEPPNGKAVIDPFANGADDIHGMLAEARAIAETVVEPGRPVDLERIAAALGSMHELVLDATENLAKLLATKTIGPLRAFGRERDEPWLGWTRQVHKALETCGPPLLDVHRALLEAWQELAERSVSTGVSVQTTNIGQQLTVPAEFASEGST
jgi:hypothetical protein